MKILILQLARLGDCFLTWPSIKALKKKHPHAEITVLTRKKFADAFFGVQDLARVVALDIQEILAPVVADQPDLLLSHQRTKEAIAALGTFDHVINLSFSPASSWLTSIIQPDSKHVTGYTRTSDGYLSIPDDMSAYFYAQVGPGRANRFHLAEIFGTLCEVDLTRQDWDFTHLINEDKNIGQVFGVIHVGASEKHKSISPEKWANIVRSIWESLRIPCYLIGSKEEKTIAETIESSTPEGSVINVTGLLTLPESFSLIGKSRFLIGADSAPIHMASLVGTATVNLSVGNVNFWETGPRAPRSYIIQKTEESEIPSDRVSRLIESLHRGEAPEVGVIQGIDKTPSYRGLFPRAQEVEWQLVQALYQGTSFPDLSKISHFSEALVQVIEVNQLMLDTLEKIKGGTSIDSLAGVLERGEEVLQTIPRLVPMWGCIIRWYQTEKVRIPPGTHDEVVVKTIAIHTLFAELLNHLGELCLAADSQSVSTGDVP